MNKKCEKLQRFLDERPEFRGRVVGYKRDRGGLGVSRIDNDWYECDDYFVSFKDIDRALKEKRN